MAPRYGREPGASQRALLREVAHGLEDPDRRDWLSWRLVPVEQQQGVSAQVAPQVLRLRPQGGASGLGAEAVSAAEAAVAEARALAEVPLEGAPGACSAGGWQALQPLVEHYGLRVLQSATTRGRQTSLRVLGPPEVAREAAALLWANLVQGRATATILQMPGQVQSIPDRMAGDFENDVKALEEECNVEVHLYTTVVWIAGSEAKAVAQAQELLQEMLGFYLPEEFIQMQGLSASTIDRLRRDADLRQLTTESDCGVALDAEAGTAWLCGKLCKAARQLIEDVAAGKTGPLQAKWEGRLHAPHAEPAPAYDEYLVEEAPIHEPAEERPRIEDPKELAGLVRTNGFEALRAELNSTGELLWPEGPTRKLSWEILEGFWAGMEESFSSQLLSKMP